MKKYKLKTRFATDYFDTKGQAIKELLKAACDLKPDEVAEVWTTDTLIPVADIENRNGRLRKTLYQFENDHFVEIPF